MKLGEPDLMFTLRMKHTRDGFHGGSESDESSTPKKIRRMYIFMDSLAISSDGHYKHFTLFTRKFLRFSTTTMPGEERAYPIKLHFEMN
jgi:hypothetical protein